METPRAKPDVAAEPADRAAPSRVGQVEQRLADLNALLGNLEPVMRHKGADHGGRLCDAEFVLKRLGGCGGLFVALRSRHPAAAEHAVRVALGCSEWSTALKLSEDDRDSLETAALLHEVGRLASSDSEASGSQGPVSLARQWSLGADILRAAPVSTKTIQIMSHGLAWFDGRAAQCSAAGDTIPLAARMLSVVDTYDAMMHETQGVTRTQALEAICHKAGTQFDPRLLLSYCKQPQTELAYQRSLVESRWLAHVADSLTARPVAAKPVESFTDPFEKKLLSNMHDGVVFVDAKGKILFWNRGAERLSGLTFEAVQQREWSIDLLHLEEGHGAPVTLDNCPVARVLKLGTQALRRMRIRGSSGRTLAVDVHAMPVVNRQGSTLGACLLLHDVSSEISLEERCQSLHELATKDPLTQVANRAEFDRVHVTFVELHRETHHPCSLIITDIDKFKSVNDTYGHQAGDDVLRTYAKLLRTSARPGDLVARYGGEEFVILCSDCDNNAAAQRAELMRAALAEVVHSSLGGRPVTASFGVTEIQPGDTPETMLRRADRALFQAKETGRNRVVQLGAGGGNGTDETLEIKPRPTAAEADALLNVELVVLGPRQMAIEKLRGFIADQHAVITSAEESRVVMQVGQSGGFLFRRNSDRRVGLIIEVTFEEEMVVVPKLVSGPERRSQQTRIHVVMQPQRRRDRRKNDALELAKQLLVSLRSYLMAALVEKDERR